MRDGNQSLVIPMSLPEKLEFFKTLYTCAENSYASKLEDFDRAMRQYKGSTEIDGSDEAAITVRNITYEIVESQVSSEIPSPKADATSYSEKRGRNATSISVSESISGVGSVSPAM